MGRRTPSPARKSPNWSPYRVHGRFHKTGPRPLPQDRSTAASTRPVRGRFPQDRISADPAPGLISPVPPSRRRRATHPPCSATSQRSRASCSPSAAPAPSGPWRPWTGTASPTRRTAARFPPWQTPAGALRLGLLSSAVAGPGHGTTAGACMSALGGPAAVLLRRRAGGSHCRSWLWC